MPEEVIRESLFQKFRVFFLLTKVSSFKVRFPGTLFQIFTRTPTIFQENKNSIFNNRLVGCFHMTGRG